MELGGVERSLLGLLDALDYARFEVDLFLFAHIGEMMKYIPAGVKLLPEEKLYRLRFAPIADLLHMGRFFIVTIRLISKIFGKLRKLLRMGEDIYTCLCIRILTFFLRKQPREYDLALGFMAPHYYLLRKVNAAIKIGWVHTDYRVELLDVSFSRKMWEETDTIAAVSEGVRASFCALYPVLADKTITVENILNPTFIRREAAAFDARPLMNAGSGFVILSVGRFCYAKAFDEAISACKILAAEGRPFCWCFIGYGMEEEFLQKQIIDMNLSDYAVILGKKENPYPYMAACDLFALSSRYEGKAVAVREAQILGKPVLIADFPTAQSQLINGFDGYICPMGAEGIAAGVRHMMDNPAFMKTLTQNVLRSDYSNKNALDELFARLEL